MDGLNEFGSFLKKLREDKGFSVNQLALYSGVSAAQISRIENGKRNIPKPDTIQKLSEALKFPYKDLLKQAGYLDSDLYTYEKYKENAPSEIKELIVKYEDILDRAVSFVTESIRRSVPVDENGKPVDLQSLSKEELKTHTSKNKKTIERLQGSDLESKLHFLNTAFDIAKHNNVPIEQYLKYKDEELNNIESFPVGKRIQLPIIGTVKAGPNGIAYEDRSGMEWVDEDSVNGGQYIWLKVKGDSMIDAGIFPGDLALVRIQPEVENGDLAVVIVNGDEGTLKRVIKKEKTLVLESANTKYPARIFTGKELENIRIVGKVKETKRKY